MRVVETLMVRDEADIVREQLDYHLASGIDFVIASDHESSDGTTEILESFARRGVLRRIPVSGPVREMEWRTRMARLAATEHGADWVVAADADEFWMPRRGTIKDVLGAVPAQFGVVGGVICHFVPRPNDGQSFAERMTFRLSQPAPIDDPTSPWRPSPKAVHRADPDAVVLHAGHRLESQKLDPLQGWYPFDVFHFPCRSLEQWARKTTRRGHGESDKPLGQYVKGLRAQEAGRMRDVFEALVVDDAALERGLEAGLLLPDTRLRDVIVGRHDPRHEQVLDPVGAFTPPVDASSLSESMIVRLQRRVDAVSIGTRSLEERRPLGISLVGRIRRSSRA